MEAYVRAFMNRWGDDDVDAKTVETVDRVNRCRAARGKSAHSYGPLWKSRKGGTRRPRRDAPALAALTQK
jgi:hypothetical protein